MEPTSHGLSGELVKAQCLRTVNKAVRIFDTKEVYMLSLVTEYNARSCELVGSLVPSSLSHCERPEASE